METGCWPPEARLVGWFWSIFYYLRRYDCLPTALPVRRARRHHNCRLVCVTRWRGGPRFLFSPKRLYCNHIYENFAQILSTIFYGLCNVHRSVEKIVVVVCCNRGFSIKTKKNQINCFKLLDIMMITWQSTSRLSLLLFIVIVVVVVLNSITGVPTTSFFRIVLSHSHLPFYRNRHIVSSHAHDLQLQLSATVLLSVVR